MEKGKGNKGRNEVDLDTLDECLVGGGELGGGTKRKGLAEREKDKVVELDSRYNEVEVHRGDFGSLSMEQRKLKTYLYYARYLNTLCLLYTIIIMIVYFASIPKFSYALYFFLFEIAQTFNFILGIYSTIKYTVCNRFIPPVSSIFIVILIFVVVIVGESQWKVIYSVMILVSTIANYLSYCIIVYEGRMENEKVVKVRLYMKRRRRF